jgi:SOS-response transcriptional repressor LexA
MSLTAQQHRLLAFLADRIRSTGVCPSITEMMAELETRSRGHVHQLIGLLEERGYLRRPVRGGARSLEIVRLPDDLSENWLRAVNTGAIARELIRRGMRLRTRPGHSLCLRCGLERRDNAPADCVQCDEDRPRAAA